MTQVGLVSRYSLFKLATLLLMLCLSSLSQALPSFARQTGFQCNACHSSFPQLTELGREFKQSGYTLSNGQSALAPIAVMLMPSFTHTQKDQADLGASTFDNNDNSALTQASIFYAGRLFGPAAESLFGKEGAEIANKFGTFLQATYDGVEHKWAWDNWELRYADHMEIGPEFAVEHLDLNYGFYVNNNPSMQDPWNSTPAWSFPFSGSGLAPSPMASPLISGGIAQQAVGTGAYLSFSNGIYLDAAAYQNISARAQSRLGVDPNDETQVAGTALYWRAAYHRNFDCCGNIEVGTFGLSADTYPGRVQSAGQDHTTDLGLDSQYQTKLTSLDDLTVRGTWVYERNHWDASQILGNTSNAKDNLTTFNISVSDLHDQTYGANVQYFIIKGAEDATLYADSSQGSPNSKGWIFQADYLPFNKNGGPDFWPKSNVKFSLQYVLYNQFDGASTNYDGNGRNAKDNNTTYLEAWVAF